MVRLLLRSHPSRAGNAVQKRLPHLNTVTEERSNELAVSKLNNLMQMYVKRGSVIDAYHVFDNMPKRNVVSWNIMILAYAQQEEGERALELYARMTYEVVQPTDRTFVAVLKACSSLAVLEEGKQLDGKRAKLESLVKGRAIHSQVVKNGVAADVFVGNTLINMYAKCGSMEDARRVFDELHHRNVVTWNIMILGYAKQEDNTMALETYVLMHQEGFSANRGSFGGALKACSSLSELKGKQCDGQSAKNGCLVKGRAIHSQVVMNGFELDIFVGTTLVDMYAKCGSMKDAHRVFDELPHHNVVTWTTIIQGYAEQGDGARALEIYARMYQEGVTADDRTFVGALKACGSLPPLEVGNHADTRFAKTGSLVKGRAIHSQILKSAFESDVFVGNSLVDMYVKCGSMKDAQRVFEKFPHRNVIMWNIMILGLAEQGDSALALELYAHMHHEVVKADQRTFVGALKACSTLAALEEGKQFDGKLVKMVPLAKGRAIHSQVVRSGFESDVFVGSISLDMYTKCGSMEDALCVFEALPHCNIVMWNIMILGYAEQGEGVLALDLHSQMNKAGVTADHRTFVGTLKACSSLGVLEKGKQVNWKFAQIGCLVKGRVIHSQVLKSGFESDVFVGTAMVDMYVKCGSMDDAHSVFDKLLHRDATVWTTIISGYAEQKDCVLALELYAQMNKDSVTADHRTFAAALKACSNLAALEDGKQDSGLVRKIGCLAKGRAIHSQVVKGGFEQYTFVGNTLLNLYAKCGSMEDAGRVFDELPHCDTVTWTTMILGYAEQKESNEAFRFYAQMQKQGLAPDSLTFVAILKACGNTAALEIGKELHSQISRFGFDTIAIVATSLVGMYAKCGSMLNALQLFDDLPARDVVTWNALIAGYAFQGESELVFLLSERMRQTGILPDGLTFLSVLTVCSHVGLVDQGQAYFQDMSIWSGIVPTIEHYACMADLLGRAGQVDEAVAMVDGMPFEPTVVVWLSLLGACRKWRNTKTGRHAFENAVRLDRKISAPYVLMASIYADANMWEDCDEIRNSAEAC